jgi:DNA-3-methyladenine glycosylase
VARDLLGCVLRSTVGNTVTEGVIIETEAYVGPHDPSSHAAERIGRTSRNAPMFGPPGTAYVYRIYGVHWCLNAVTEGEEFPAAVLIRALDPTAGIGYMEGRRRGTRPLCSGPGRLAQALGITGDLNGHTLRNDPLTISAGWPIEEANVGVSGRVGVSRAGDWPLRYFVRDHPEVSKHRGEKR